MYKTTYYQESQAREVAWKMTQASCSPVWIYPAYGGWQLTGRGDLVLSQAVTPPLLLTAELTRTRPNFQRGHTLRQVYRVAFIGDVFTQMHQQVEAETIAVALRQGAAIVIARKKDQRIYNRDMMRILGPYMQSHYLAQLTCGPRHTVLLANRVRESALADIYDTIVLHQILGAESHLFEGVIPYGEDTRG